MEHLGTLTEHEASLMDGLAALMEHHACLMEYQRWVMGAREAGTSDETPRITRPAFEYEARDSSVVLWEGLFQKPGHIGKVDADVPERRVAAVQLSEEPTKSQILAGDVDVVTARRHEVKVRRGMANEEEVASVRYRPVTLVANQSSGLNRLLPVNPDLSQRLLE